MVYKGMHVFIIVLLTGCAASDIQKKKIYSAEYRKEVSQRMAAVVSEFKNTQTYHWKKPITQEVMVPAHIANGVFIPAHKEIVIIKPGEWTLSPASPIVSKEEAYEEGVRLDISSADITHLPGGHGWSRDDESEGKDRGSKAGVGAAQ